MPRTPRDTPPDHPVLADAIGLLERGDNRAARARLAAIGDDAPAEVQRARDALLARMRPDRVALAVFAISLVLVVVVAILALSHSAGG